MPQRTSPCGNIIGIPAVALASIALFFCTNLQAENIAQYAFTGQIPAGAVDSHSEIGIGESWEANFFVDLDTPDDNPANVTQGMYVGAVVSGSLSFSGGYATIFDFSDFDILVTIGPDSNLIQVSDPDPISSAAFAFVTTDLSTLTTDSLPEPGTMGSAVLPTFPSNVGMLLLNDDNGLIVYRASEATNVEFSVSAVPEPSSLFAILLMTMTVAIRRHK